MKPSHKVGILLKKHGFGEKQVLDIGCNKGEDTFWFGKGSEGLEIQKEYPDYLYGTFKVHHLNVEDGVSTMKGKKYDAIYANNIIEHLVAPHLFLKRCHSLLKQNGLLAIGCPMTPPSAVSRIYNIMGRRGWKSVTHVNFFTPETFRLTLEMAGFHVLARYGTRNLPKTCSEWWLSCLFVCERVDGYKYDRKRLVEFTPSWASDLKEWHNETKN